MLYKRSYSVGNITAITFKNVVKKSIPWREQQQPAMAAARTRISVKHSKSSVLVTEGGKADFKEATVWVNSVVIEHTGILSLEARGVAVIAA